MFAKMLLTGFAAAALALAQGPPGGGGMGPPGGMGGGGGNMGGGNMGGGMGGPMGYHPKESKAELMAKRLKLTDEQRSEVNTILDATHKDAASVIQQVLKSRQDVANAMVNNKSEAEMAPLVKALSDAQFQMTGVEVKTFQRIVALLKPNQASKAPEAFDLMADIFLPQGGGRGGGR
jgi:Spy/CpxP family protein refolding chaperone